MKQIPNIFTSYELSERNVLEGSILNQFQKALIQNQLSEIAEQIMGLVFDTKDHAAFVQQDAFLKGQMSILRVLLLRSEESEKQLLSLSLNPGA
jgi:hypothetical protein